MRTIWKFDIPVADYFELGIPAGGDVLSVHTQNGIPRLWVIVDPSMPVVQTGFILHGTGHTVSDKAGRYVGTFLVEHDALVFHLFEAQV